MSRIIVDDETLKKWGDVQGTSLLCDSRGNVIGVVSRNQLVLEPQISEEEFRRRVETPGPRYSTEEVLKKLESLK